MKRLAIAVSVLVVCACRSEKKPPPPQLAQDTTPVNLDSIQTTIPPAAPDTFTRPKPVVARPAIPSAPPELMAVVEREQSFSKFCYQEYGQKVDPSLAGGVAMVVTVSGTGVSEAKVRADTWSSHSAGVKVNDCLNEKAANAWKTAAGTVKPGQYVVQLAFRPT